MPEASRIPVHTPNAPRRSMPTHTLNTSTHSPPLDPRYVKNQQGSDGLVHCCVSAALCTCYELITNYDEEMAVLYHYYRVARGDVLRGMTAQEGVDSAELDGICPLQFHDHEMSRLSAGRSPSTAADDDAYERRLASIGDGFEELSPNDLAAWRQHLDNGSPLLLTFYQYKSEYEQIPFKNNTHLTVLTGPQPRFAHAVTIIGYDLARARFRIQDCQGTDWADHGRWYLPFSLAQQQSFTMAVYAIKRLIERTHS